MFKWVDPMTEFGKLFLSFLLGALLVALLFDRCGKKPTAGEILTPADTSSHSEVFAPEPISVQPAKPDEVVRVVYRDRWREWFPDDSSTVSSSVCDSLMQFRTYELKTGSEKVDITAHIKVLGYIDSSRIDWKMNIPEVRMPPLKRIFIGGFVGQSYGGHVAYMNSRTMYFIQYDNRKEVRAGVAVGF